MTAPNLVLCEACGSEGHLYSGHPNDPHPVYAGECSVCRGTGLIDRDAKARGEPRPTKTEGEG